jgi:hypothetical protein
MALRKAAALTVASLAVVAGLAGTASASPSSASANNNATVAGVTPRTATGNRDDCPTGNLCLYTGTNYTGKRFDLYACKTYSLSNWDGNGSVLNNQSTGQTAWFQGVNHNVVATIDGPTSGGVIAGWGLFDFAPIWYAKNC